MLKKIIGKKKIIMLMLGIIVGILISIVSVYAATLIDSKNVTYSNTTSKLNSTNVQNAIDELYNRIDYNAISYILDLYNKSPKVNIDFNSCSDLDDLLTQATNTNLVKNIFSEIRYYGANPNNYVTFNNEKNSWRIIGIVQNRVKIIRESIGIYTWNNIGINNWQTSSLKDYLNSNYYNSLTATAKNMIEKNQWYLNGPDVINNYSIYYHSNLCPRDYHNTEISGGIYGDNWRDMADNIGLIYPSDYGYAADLSKCQTPLMNYNNTNCASTNWLIDPNYYWTITPSSTTSDSVVVICPDGHVGYTAVASTVTSAVRPVVYLKSNVMITSGNGSKDNPYQLKLA